MQIDYLDFTNDLALPSHTNQRILVKTVSVVAAHALVGLSTHKGKTKIFKYNTENTNTITLDEETLEGVETFTYLGNIIDEQGRF